MTKEEKAAAKKAKENKFLAESQANAPAAPDARTLALFTAAEAIPGGGKLERRNLPQMVKPDEVPVGAAVVGEIVKIVDSPVSTIKGKLLWMRHASGTEFMFPCTGVIRSALAPGIKDDDGEKLKTALEKEIGKILVAKRQADKVTTKFDKTGKRMFVFDVYTTAKAK